MSEELRDAIAALLEQQLRSRRGILPITDDYYAAADALLASEQLTIGLRDDLEDDIAESMQDPAFREAYAKAQAMTEERSCEEAFEEWWNDKESVTRGFNPAWVDLARSLQRDGFIAGAAWARTPTLPAGAEDRMAATLARAYIAFAHTREYLGEDVLPAIPGWSWFDVSEEIKAVLADAGCPLPEPRVIEPLPEGLPTANPAAGDRPPAEREERKWAAALLWTDVVRDGEIATVRAVFYEPDRRPERVRLLRQAFDEWWTRDNADPLRPGRDSHWIAFHAGAGCEEIR